MFITDKHRIGSCVLNSGHCCTRLALPRWYHLTHTSPVPLLEPCKPLRERPSCTKTAPLLCQMLGCMGLLWFLCCNAMIFASIDQVCTGGVAVCWYCSLSRSYDPYWAVNRQDKTSVCVCVCVRVRVCVHVCVSVCVCASLSFLRKSFVHTCKHLIFHSENLYLLAMYLHNKSIAYSLYNIMTNSYS